MEFIIGGAFQNKIEFAAKRYGYHFNRIADGSDFLESREAEEKLKKQITKGTTLAVSHVERMIEKWLKQDRDPKKELEQLLDLNDSLILIMDEIGYGLVPVDAVERKYRETAGRIGCYLAKRAKTVIRVVCGIGTVIK